MLNKHEAVLLREFLEELSEIQGNAGCNDHRMANTPENREVLIRALRFGFNPSDAEESIGWLPDETSEEDIYTSDFILYDYLVHLFEIHLRIAVTPPDEEKE